MGVNKQLKKKLKRSLRNVQTWSAWPAQLVECVTLVLGVISSSPILVVEITLKEIIKSLKKCSDSLVIRGMKIN